MKQMFRILIILLLLISCISNSKIENGNYFEKIDGLNIKISSLYLGKFNSEKSKFNRRIRFFRKSVGFYPEKLVHESIFVKGKIAKAKGFIYDYGTLNLKTHLNKINEYSSFR